jgi:hypothetical protein
MKVVIKVTVDPDEGMGMDSPEIVLDLIQEAIRGTGMDNGASIEVELFEDATAHCPNCDGDHL